MKATRIYVPGMGSANKLGKYVPAYVEIGVLVALAVVLILFVVLRWSKPGRSFYAVGGNKYSANITVAAMICLFLVIQSLVLLRKNKDTGK